MNTFIYLTYDPVTTSLFAGLFGLLVGSFLNVVVYRLPIMMEREWQTECTELKNRPSLLPQRNRQKRNQIKYRRRRPQVPAKRTVRKPQLPSQPPKFDLVYPGSHCPHCGHPITVLENIPILSYVWQGGKCTVCRRPISLRYPFTEALSAILAMLTAWHFGFGWPLLFALFLTWALLAASLIDYDHQLLPDQITLPFLWLGILCNNFGLYTDLSSSILGAVAGYLSLWTVFWLFKLLTGKDGMGYGDFKLLAMLGAWMGWQGLLMTIFLASLAGTVIGLTLILSSHHNKSRPFPFGPYLAIAGWLNFLWGTYITETVQSWTTYLSGLLI